MDGVWTYPYSLYLPPHTTNTQNQPAKIEAWKLHLADFLAQTECANKWHY